MAAAVEMNLDRSPSLKQDRGGIQLVAATDSSSSEYEPSSFCSK
jgi:hypothetical protein